MVLPAVIVAIAFARVVGAEMEEPELDALPEGETYRSQA